MASSLAVSVRPRILGAGAASAAAALPAADLPADLLHEVLRTVRDVLGAERASLLALESEHLVPTASSARHDNPVRWSRFRAMPPLPIDGLPRLRDLLAAGRVEVVDDLAAAALVPAQWWPALGVRSVALAPVTGVGGPIGLLVVDHGGRPHEFSAGEVGALAALARTVGAAVRAACDQLVARSRAANANRVLDLVTALDAATSPERVLRLALDGAREVLCGISAAALRFDGDDVTVVAYDGPGQPEPGRRRLPRYGAAGLDELRALWRSDPAAPIVLAAAEAGPLAAAAGGAGVPTYAVLPLPGSAGVQGALVVGLRDSVDQASVSAAARYAVAVAAALSRVRREAGSARRAERAELLHRLADEMSVAPQLARALQRIAPAVGAAGAEIVDGFLCDPSVAELLAAPVPQPPLDALLASWRRRRVRRPTEVGGLLVVPLVGEDGPVGLIRVRPLGDHVDEAELAAVADGLAATLCRAVLRLRVAAAERDRIVEQERERLARDLHDTLGQALFGIALDVEDCATQASGGLRDRLAAVRDAVGTANAEVRQAIHALSFVDCGRDGLVPALRALGERVGTTAAPVVDVRVTGKPVRLRPAAEDAIYRVAYEALQNVRRHSGATTALVELAFGSERVSLTVCDDGRGIPSDAAAQPGLHFGLRTMRRRMEEAGGGLEIRNASPRGVLVAAWVAAG